MIRASVHFNGKTGWLIDFSELPRIGDTIRLQNLDGEDLHRGRVTSVERFAIASPESEVESRAGEQFIEVIVDGD